MTGGTLLAVRSRARSCGRLVGRGLGRSCALGLAAGDGSAGIANPLAPGSGVQLAAAKPGHLEAQQIVTGGDAGAAHGDQIRRIAARETFLPATLAFGGGQKTTVCAEIDCKRVIHRAGYVSGPRIDWFHPARIALLGA